MGPLLKPTRRLVGWHLEEVSTARSKETRANYDQDARPTFQANEREESRVFHGERDFPGQFASPTKKLHP
jgi:hypothetical protein